MDVEMLLIADRKSARIRGLNDAFRTTFQGGRIMLTSGFNALPEAVRSHALRQLQNYQAFDPANDPYGEHDFISFTVEGHGIFAKIDYYDRDIRFGADDPSDPEHTVRIMTIMLDHEY
jgi:hypothetical protein